MVYRLSVEVVSREQQLSASALQHRVQLFRSEVHYFVKVAAELVHNYDFSNRLLWGVRVGSVMDGGVVGLRVKGRSVDTETAGHFITENRPSNCK